MKDERTLVKKRFTHATDLNALTNVFLLYINRDQKCYSGHQFPQVIREGTTSIVGISKVQKIPFPSLYIALLKPRRKNDC